MILFVLEGQCRSFREVPAGARITYVNGREVVDLCEVCQQPVYYGKNCRPWSDCVTHKWCIPKRKGVKAGG